MAMAAHHAPTGRTSVIRTGAAASIDMAIGPRSPQASDCVLSAVIATRKARAPTAAYRRHGAYRRSTPGSRRTKRPEVSARGSGR